MTVTIHTGEALAVLKTLPDQRAHCCVTSPPYWGLRDYGEPEQLGLEPTPEEYVARLVEIFEEVRRVLRDDGTLWLNMGDRYCTGGHGGGGSLSVKRKSFRGKVGNRGWRSAPPGYKDKDLSGVAFALAAALRVDGWYFRQTIIWAKPAAIEPPRMDRPATSHEYLFLFSKRNDSAARDPGEAWWGRSVWEIGVAHGPSGHPARMPDELASRCIKAGCSKGGTVLDPFGGAGTTGLVADRLGRDAVLIELSPTYAEMARERIKGDCPLFADVVG